MTCRREPVITIDGPAGAGKSTTAREVARRLGFKLVDTGALYRALAWALREAGLAPDDEAGIATLLTRTRVELADGSVLVNGRDVTSELGREIQDPGQFPELVSPLHADARREVPEGELACGFHDLAERARRRRDELAAQGQPADYESVKAEVALRDRQDTERELAPLRKPPGAVTVDSTALSPEAVVLRILDAVEQARCCTGS